jgi:hypothetical protein
MQDIDNFHVFSSVVINAWYAAQRVYMAEKGRALTDEEKRKLLIKVSGQIIQMRQLVMTLTPNDPLEKAVESFHRIVMSDPEFS